MDEHLRFCKRTYKNDPRPLRTYSAGILNFVQRPSDNPEPGEAYYDTETERVLVFLEGNWIEMTGPGNA